MVKVVSRRKYSLLATWVVLTIVLGALAVTMFNEIYDVRSPIVRKEQKIVSPLSDKKTEPKKQSLIKIQQAYAEEPEVISDVKTDLEIAQYIALKDWDYETAIKVAKSENAWRSRGHFDCTIDNSGTNRDGTIDYGIFQINNIHRKFVEDYYSRPFEEVVTNCFDNIDVAYMVYERNHNSWTPWAAYNNGSYAGHEVIKL